MNKEMFDRFAKKRDEYFAEEELIAVHCRAMVEAAIEGLRQTLYRISKEDKLFGNHIQRYHGEWLNFEGFSLNFHTEENGFYAILYEYGSRDSFDTESFFVSAEWFDDLHYAKNFTDRMVAAFRKSYEEQSRAADVLKQMKIRKLEEELKELRGE